MKHFFTGLLSLFIALLICVFCMSFSAKTIVVNTLSKQVVKKEISSNVIETIKDLYEDASYDALEKIEINIGNSEEIDRITEKYFDNIISTIIDEKEVVAPKTKDEIVSLINENEAILNENGVYITDIDKEKIVNDLIENKKIDRIYENVVNKVKTNLSEDEIKVIKIYNVVIKNDFRWIIVGMVTVSILLIALIKKTYYRWTYNLAVAFVLSGILLSFVTPLISDVILMPICENLIGQTTEINLNALVNSGYICFCLSALLIIIYLVGNKITNYKIRKEDY